jgi:hypothetical protein
MWRGSTVALTGALLLAGATGTAAGREPPHQFSNLDPGGPAHLTERLPVQFVFVGYRGLVNEKAFRSQLPEKSAPVVRSRLWYKQKEPVGLEYDFDYKVVFADRAYADAFFGALSSLAVPEESVEGRPRTLYQDLYNHQAANVLEVGENHFIDGPSVERWLIRHPVPGVDFTRNTVVFVNWWGRSDFRFHTYTKFGEPDADTGYDFGVNRQSRKLIAWGGTPPDDEETGAGGPTHRVWFHDLSAGPDANTGGWNVDDSDLDGDDKDDRRHPPVWEYLTAGGYRDPGDITLDLGAVARYVGIDLLFAASPIYPPYLTPHRLPSSINLDVNTYRDRGPGLTGTYQQADLVVKELRKLIRTPLTLDTQELPLQNDAEVCFHQYIRLAPCYPDYSHYPAEADFFLYHAQHLDEVRDGGGEYEAVVADYVTQDATDFLGLADDNWLDGTQSVVLGMLTPGEVASGYGLTGTHIHEVGHHLGLSHPHDGFDPAENRDFDATGKLFFAWVGDEVNSVMSYIDVNWDFSVFDRDNMDRFQAAAHLRSTNAIAADVLRSGNATAGLAELALADQDAGEAQTALSAHDYPGAFAQARSAYRHSRRAAELTGVEVVADELTPWALQATESAGARDPAKPRRSAVDHIGPTTHRGAP